jgi:hypothetical protein
MCERTTGGTLTRLASLFSVEVRAAFEPAYGKILIFNP